METIGKIKCKAEYIADLCIDMLANNRTMPDVYAAEILRKLEECADVVTEYSGFDDLE